MARFRVFGLAAIAALTLLGMQHGLAHAQEKQNAKSTSAAAPAASASVEAQQAQFAGAESCKSCHEEVYDSWEKSAHWQQTYKEGGIAKHGCEDCHGPAASHVSDPTDTSKLFLFEKASAKEI
ncbi:MAG: hypothetical protein WCC18_04875, partial [Candidatus Acidiferrales bacterium]